MSSWHTSLGVFDLETTGVDVTTSRIVTAYVGLLDEAGEVVEEQRWLADPGVEIPEGATAVHGVTSSMARNLGEPAAQVTWEIVDALRKLLVRGIPITIYNAPYDLALLRHEAARHGIEPLHEPAPIIDPLVIDRAVDTYRRGKRTLTAAAELYGVVLDDAHDAGADAIAAGRVAQALVRRYPEELDIPVMDLHGRQEIWFARQAASFQDWMRRKHDPAFVAPVDWPLRTPEAA